MDRLELNSRTSWTTRFLSILLSGIMLATPFSAVAQLPTNPDLVHGSVDFNQQGASLFMNQSSNAAVVNFDSFSIGAQNGVYITQPGATSALLSRVVGADPSVIHGLLDATGIVYLVNQNGIYFGGNSRIDAAGLVASTLDISDANFLAGKNIFEGDSTASIVNEGSISAADFIIFLATNIRNAGDLSAASVTMAAAEKVTLQNVYGGVLSVDITGMLGEIDNNGVIEITTPDSDITPGAYFTGRELTSYGNINRDGGEDGGYIVFDASENTAIGGIINAGDVGTVDLLGSLSVTVEADTVISAPGGTIVAQAAAGDTLVSGAIDVSSDDGQGGTAQVLGQRVGLLDSATVDASGATGGGAVNVGGNFQGNGDLQNARHTFVGSNVVIDIDAVDSGDGGTAIVWADGSTEFNGTITGRGAGFAEVSGKETLAFNGQVDLLGHNGELGTLLLDPADILVTDHG
ncbi:MAG: filamentous hemagglutinin N-terminal domain-containing protein, partial [Lentisphaeria bacterium]